MVIMIQILKFCQIANSVSSDDKHKISNDNDKEQGTWTKFRTE